MTKRTYGSGAVYQRRSDSRWVAAVRDPGGRRRVKYFSSEAAARAAVVPMLRESARVYSKITLGDFLEAWLATMRPPRLRPSTWVSYELHVRHLSPLAAVPLDRLSPMDIRLHLRAMTDAGHSARSVQLNLTVLRMALKQAERDGVVERNVALEVDPPKVGDHEQRILTQAQAKKLIAAKDPLWTLLVTTGLRLGEALALRWRDIDQARGTVTVTGSLRPIPAAFRGSGPRLQRVDVKTKSGRRTVALPVALELARPEVENIEGYVFTTPKGTPRDPRNVSRDWEDTRKALGFPDDVTIHALRHTAVSMALAGGATLDDVKRMVGHSTIAMTSDLYGHMVDGRAAETANRLADGLAGRRR